MVNDKKLLTIIIPQHSENEEMISHLLNSINYQVGLSLSDVDIKIVGDGGYKLSNEYLNSFNDLNIDYIYYKTPHGPGHARQVGTEQANSKYISYLDADDQLNTINSLWKFIDVINKTGDHEIIFSKYVEEFPPDDRGRHNFNLREFNPSAAYGKWISLKYIRDHKLIWHPLLTHAFEDTFFLDMVITFSNDVYYLDSPTYSWLHNPNSIVREGTDYNRLHLNEYVLENRLWAEEIKKRAPERYRFDVNNGLGHVYSFITNHPPVDEIKDKVEYELHRYLNDNKDIIDLEYAQKLLEDNHKDIDANKFNLFIKNELKKIHIKPGNQNDDSTKKFLSIVVPFNSDEVAELDSLLSSINYQVGVNLDDIEILIIKDGGAAISSDIKNRFPDLNIRLLLSSDNLGPGPMRSIGIRESAGEFIMFCDSDDQLHVDNGLLMMKNKLNENPDSQIIMGKYVNEQLDANGNVCLVEWDYNFGAVYPSWFNLSFLRSHLIDFHPDLHSYYEDTFFVGIAFKIAEKIAFVDKPIYTHRFNQNSMIHLLKGDSIHKKFLIETCKENYYWFKEGRLRFPDDLTNDINNFVVTLYYMYKSYNIASKELDNEITSITHKIVSENKRYWNGWTPTVQEIADGRNDGDAEGIDSNGLKDFINQFFKS
ncbi:glycosyltransferase [Lactobacillaceae bacterium Scapto_B20]